MNRHVEMIQRKHQARLRGGALGIEPTVILLAEIDPDPNQPRQTRSESKLRSLSESVLEHGVRLPVSVRAHPTTPGRWMLVKGERRWRAAQRAGLTRIPVLIETINDADALELQLIANTQREGQHHLELGDAVFRLLQHRAQQWNPSVRLETVLELLAAEERQDRNGKRKLAKTEASVLAFVQDHGDEIRRTIKQYSNKKPRSFFESVVQIRLKAPEVFAGAVAGDLGIRVACELARVQNPVTRDKLLVQATQEAWSHAQTKRAVLALEAKPKTDDRSSSDVGLLRKLSRGFGTYDEDLKRELGPHLRKMETILKRHGMADMSAKTTKDQKKPSATTR